MLESDESLEESPSMDVPPEVPAAMAHARHRFLLLGIGFAMIIVTALAWLNEAAKEESKFQQAVSSVNLKPRPVNPAPGLAYQPPPKESTISHISSSPAKPAEILSPAPTTPAPPHE